MNVLGDLLFRLGVDLASLNRDMRAARTTVDGAMTGIARSANMATRAMQGFVGALSVRELARISDQFKTINATLEIATRSAESGAYAYQQVFQVAMRSGQALDSVAVTYRRFAENSKELGISQDEVARATETVAKAMALSGGSYQSTQAALLQFSQALASGVLRGQELNSVLEQSPRLARLIADGMQVPIGALRSLAEEGKITTDVLIQALQSQGQVIDEEFNKLPMTFARAINNLQSGFTNLVGIFESGTGVFGMLANGIDFIAQNLDKLVNVVIAASLVGFGRLLTTIISLSAAKLAMAANVGVLTTATVALNGALSLVGGPAGAIIMAMSALYAFRGELGLVSEAYAKNITMLDEFKAGMESTGGFFSSLAILGTMNPFLNLEEQVAKYTKEIEYLEEQQKRYSETMQDILGISLDLEIAQKRLAYAENLLARANRDANNARAFGATAMDTHTAAYLKMTGEADKYIKSLEHEFQLIGLTNEERIVAIGLRKFEELGITAGTEAHEKYVSQLIEIARRIRIKTEMVDLSKQAAANAKREAEEYKRLTENLTEQIAKMRIENETFGQGNEERERAIFLREAENLKIEDRNRLVAEYDEVYAVKKANIERKKANEERLKEEKEFAKEIEKINDQIGQSLTDALMSGSMNAKDFIINMFKTMVLRPLLQPIITGVVGSLGIGAAGAALAGTTGGGGASAMGQAVGLFSLANAAKTAYGFITGGFEAIGTMASTIASTFEVASTYGTGLLSQQTAMLAAQEAGMSTFSAAAGAAAQYLAGIGAGVMAGQMISGKYSVGGSSYLATGGGAIIGAIVGGPIGAAIGGAIGGVINRAFGMAPKETVSAGYDLTLTAMGALTKGFEKWEQDGGWFRKSRSGKEVTEVAKETVDYFNQTAAAVGLGIAGMSKMLGASIDNINNFSLDIVIETLGATKEQIEEQITGAFAYMETSLVDFLIPSIYEFAAAGDKTAADILKRLTNSVTTVNQAFEVLGYSLYEVSLQGAAASYKMIELFGGFENFTKATSFYYENFYSLQEKVNFQTEQMTKIFEGLGKELPATKDNFRAMVEAAKAAGDDQLFATLVQLAPSFNNLQTSMQQLGAATEGVVDSIGNSARDLERIAQQRYSLETKILELQGNQEELRKRELETIDESNRELQKQIWALEDARDASRAAEQAAKDQAQAETERQRELERQRAEEQRQLKEAYASASKETDNALSNLKKNLETQLNEQIAVMEASLKVILNGISSTIDLITASLAELATATKNTDFAFNRVKEAIELETAQKIASYTAQYETQKSLLEAQIATQEAAKESASTYVNELRSVFDTLKSSIQTLANPAQKSSVVSSAMEAIAAAITSARGGGAIANTKGLNEAIATATSGVAEASYTSAFEAEKANAVLRNQLIELQGYTSTQLTTAESQLAATEAQVELLTKQLETLNTAKDAAVKEYEDKRNFDIDALQQQVDALRSIDQSVLDLNGLMSEFNNALAIEQARMADVQALIGQNQKIDQELLIKLAEDQVSFLNQQLDLAQQQHDDAVAEAKRINAEQLYYYQQQINELRGIKEAATDVSGAIRELMAALRFESQSLGKDVPAFASGGRYRGGMALVGEDGPELINFSQPGMVYSNSQLRNSMSGNDTASEVRALREENRVQARSMVALQAKMTRLMERWDGDGLPEQRAVTV